MFTHADLVHFNGTENYYHHPLRLLKLTDGTHFLEQNGAGWLVDAIVDCHERLGPPHHYQLYRQRLPRLGSLLQKPGWRVRHDDVRRP